MNFTDLAALAATLVATVYPAVESIKTQANNLFIKELTLKEKTQKIGFFIVGMGVTIGTAFFLKNSSLIEFEVLKTLNNTDTFLLGGYAGLVITGGKDAISSISKGKNLANDLKVELSKLSADEVANVAFEVMEKKGVVFTEDLSDGKGQTNDLPEIDVEDVESKVEEE